MKRGGGWLLLCVVHGAASMLMWWMGEQQVRLFTWQADTWMLRPWTLWTSAWVHVNTPHLITNQIALGFLTGLAWLLRPDLRAALAWLLTWPLLQLSLVLWPQVGYSVGLSGLLHAGAMIMALQLVLGRIHAHKAQRWGLMLVAGLLTKLVLERAWFYPVVWDPGSDRSVVQAAHLCGAAWGALLTLVLDLSRRRPVPPR
ncbi:MAG: rhomboid family intramembrane serine protease [Burkholderiales bacterium]|nr:MAG: rhomboid family intramembrane serine protease [Burkholderiales bacterium]